MYCSLRCPSTKEPMPRIFPRPVESAIRVLKQICNDAQNPTALRARSAELLLAAYGYANLRSDEEPRHRSAKKIAAARVEVSSLDKEISARVSADRKQKKIERQIDALLTGKEQQ
jgi:hypothetical protein